MKTKIILLIIIIVLPNLAFSQKDKNEYINFSYVQLPLKPLNNDYKTFSVRTTSTSGSMIQRRIMLPGFSINTNLNETGDIIIEFNEDPFYVDTREINSIAHEVTRDNVKKTTYTYIIRLTYKHGINYKVFTKEGNVLFERVYADSKFKEFKSKEFNSDREARDNVTNVMNGIEISEQDDAIKQLNAALADNFAYPLTTQQICLFSIKPKKFNYDNFNLAISKAKNAINLMSSLYGKINNPRETDFSNFSGEFSQAADSIKESISLLETELKESNLEEKKSRINEDVTIDIHLNLATLYIILNNFPKAEEHIAETRKLKKFSPWNNFNTDLCKAQKERYHINYPTVF